MVGHGIKFILFCFTGCTSLDYIICWQTYASFLSHIPTKFIYIFTTCTTAQAYQNYRHTSAHNLLYTRKDICYFIALDVVLRFLWMAR
jgi:hypothetical protein